MQIDAATAALLGILIGGIIGLVGTSITVTSSARLQVRAYNQANHQQKLERVIAAYEFALNVCFNLIRDGNPDRATFGAMFAQLSLHGSEKVKKIMEDYLELPTNQSKSLDIKRLYSAMAEHIADLEK
jgi:hypothetical protein